MTYFQRLILALFLISACSLQAYAVTYTELLQQVTAFEKSGQARFAPASMKKVIAYQGASMLAFEKQKSSFSNADNGSPQSEELENAIEQTLSVLEEAKNNAHTFTSNFRALLALEVEANKAYVYHHKPQLMPEPHVEALYNEGKKQLETAIVATEDGRLNLAKQAAEKAALAYGQCIDAALPGLVEQTSRAISQASSLGAKRHAPKLWQMTETHFESLELYYEDMQRPDEEKEGIPRPENIGLALETAIFTQKMAIQVKEWQRDHGSLEKLALAARKARQEIAQALQLPLDYDKIDFDIEQRILVQHVKTLTTSLIAERKQHSEQISAMNISFDRRLQEALEQQHAEDQQIFQAKLSNMKSAFSTKLEQETFETKRQKKLRMIFKREEADIIANIDGSLMIRAKAIQFGPNSSKVDGQYFDFLARIKEALSLYPDRLVKIEGHTDSTGDEKANRELSLQRAEAVQEFLIAAGVSPDRVRALGFGEVKPIASNMYKQGRAMNRRIDITIEAPKHG